MNVSTVFFFLVLGTVGCGQRESKSNTKSAKSEAWTKEVGGFAKGSHYDQNAANSCYLQLQNGINELSIKCLNQGRIPTVTYINQCTFVASGPEGSYWAGDAEIRCD